MCSREAPRDWGQKRTGQNKIEAVNTTNSPQGVTRSSRGFWHQERVSFKMEQMSNLDKGEREAGVTSQSGCGGQGEHLGSEGGRGDMGRGGH